MRSTGAVRQGAAGPRESSPESRPHVVVIGGPHSARDARIRKTSGTLNRAGARVTVINAAQRMSAYQRRALRERLSVLAPDVIQVHGAHALGALVEAARPAHPTRAGLLDSAVVYDTGVLPPAHRSPGVRRPRLSRDLGARSRSERAHIGLADVVVTASGAAAEVLQREHGLAKPPVVVHDAPLLAGAARSSRDLRADVGVERGVPLLVWCGTPAPDDGLETVVEALPFLSGVHVAVIAGPKARLDHLWETARSWDVEDRVHVVRGVSSQEMADYVSAADGAVLPAHPGSTHHETTLRPELFDYVQAGLPVVTSEAAVAVRDFVLGHGLGAVCRLRDPVSLALAIRELLTTVREPVTHAVRQQHSWEGQEPRLLGAYASLADRWPRLGALASHPGLDRQRASVA